MYLIFHPAKDTQKKMIVCMEVDRFASSNSIVKGVYLIKVGRGWRRGLCSSDEKLNGAGKKLVLWVWG